MAQLAKDTLAIASLIAATAAFIGLHAWMIVQ